MGRKKEQRSQGLGRALIKQKQRQAASIGAPTPKKPDPNSVHSRNKNIQPLAETADMIQQAAHTDLRSITDFTDLEEYLASVTQAQERYDAERAQRLIMVGEDADETEANLAHESQLPYVALSIPRRPQWTADMSKSEIDSQESRAFVDWRRALSAQTEAGVRRTDGTNSRELTPYERNLEVWRQLWRVVERSNVVCQILDARNPLLFRSRDLEAYIQEVAQQQQTTKKHILIINKADFLSPTMRREWARYFTDSKVRFLYFSALAEQIVQGIEPKSHREQASSSTLKHMQQAGGASAASAARRTGTESGDDDLYGMDADSSEDDDDSEDGSDAEAEAEAESPAVEQPSPAAASAAPADSPAAPAAAAAAAPAAAAEPSAASIVGLDDPIAVLNVDSLLARLEHECAAVIAEEGRATVGLVGHPNVGKSSLINVLCGAKRVAVAGTPGKTKHFQTIELGAVPITLCDCPGLVFPTFVNSRSDLVVNGILPIDQLRGDIVQPIRILARHISVAQLEAVYHGLAAHLQPLAFGRPHVTARDLLQAYAFYRGWYRRSKQPLEFKAGKTLLKDYVAGRLVFVEPPPTLDDEASRVFLASLRIPELDEQNAAAFAVAARTGEALDPEMRGTWDVSAAPDLAADPENYVPADPLAADPTLALLTEDPNAMDDKKFAASKRKHLKKVRKAKKDSRHAAWSAKLATSKDGGFNVQGGVQHHLGKPDPRFRVE